MKQFLICCGLTLMLTGCSTQAWYEAAQEARKEQCDTLSGSQRESCLEGTDKSYDEYEKDRRSVR